MQIDYVCLVLSELKFIDLYNYIQQNYSIIIGQELCMHLIPNCIPIKCLWQWHISIEESEPLTGEISPKGTQTEFAIMWNDFVMDFTEYTINK